MKKTLLIGLLLALPFLLFNSCSKDDGALEGRWQYNTIQFSGLPAGISFDPDDMVEPCAKQGWMEFIPGGAFNVKDGCDASGMIQSGTWVQSGNTVTMTVDGEVQMFVIKSISSSELVVDATAEFSEEISIQGMSILMKFKRIN